MRILFIFSLLLLSRFLFGQEYLHKKYSTENGLEQNQVTKLYQDSQGFLWIGTKGGISIFDGLNFTNYTVNDGLLGSEVLGILEYEKGSIWVLTKKGLNEFKNFRLTTHPIAKQIENFIVFVYPPQYDFKRKELYIAAREEKNFSLYSYDGKKLKFITILNNFRFSYLEHLNIIGYDSTLLHLNNYTKEKVNYPTHLLYQIDTNKIISIAYDNIEELDTNLNFIRKRNIKNMMFYKTKSLFDSLISIKNYESEISYLAGAYVSILNNKQLFIGHNLGLLKSANKAFLHFEATKNKFSDIWSVFQLQNSIYLMSFIGKNAIINANTLKLNTFQTKNSYYFGSALFNKQTQIQGTSIGVELISNKKSNIYANKIYGISFIYKNTDNNNWIICHTKGLSFMDNNLKFKHFINSEKNDFAYPLCIEKDKFDSLWIVGSDRINKYKNNKFTKVGGLIAETGAFTVKQDDRQNLWFGSKHGLIFYNYKKFKKIKHPHLTNIVTTIFQVDKKRLLIGTTKGMAMLDLDLFYNNDSIFVQWFDKTNGFATTECQQNSFYLAPDGYIWIPLTDRVVRIDTSELKFNTTTAQPIIKSITDLDISEKFYIKHDSFYNFRPEKSNFRIEFTAIEFKNPEKIKFSHRLIGQNKHWSKPDFYRYIDYTNLPFGTYQFELIAYNESFIKSKPVSFNFEIQKKWHQYYIIRLFSVISIILLLLWASRAYFKKKIAQDEETKYIQKDIERLRAHLLIKQLDNHFIFNAIAAAGNLAFKGTPNAQYKYIVNLANLLRYLLKNKEEVSVSFSEELKHIFILTEIQKLRFSNRIQFNFKQNISDYDTEKLRIPKLFLFHFVENAIKYSTESTSKIGVINFSITKTNKNFCCIRIEDNSLGNDNIDSNTELGLTNNRLLINLLNKNNKDEIYYKITKKPDGQSGLIVDINIPFNYNYDIGYESTNSRG